jgi:hypothetical protein
MVPRNDLTCYGINFYNNHSYTCTIVYDGSLLTMTLLDTTTSAQARFAWPLNLAATTNANALNFGFTCGNGATADFNQYINSWALYSGFNTRLATPTASPAAGSYSGSQTVSISGPVGASIYYTTNGFLPTSSSTLYTGPITVSASEVVQAVAIQTGFTDSLVLSANYAIGSTTDVIHFPSGFPSSVLAAVGYVSYGSSVYQLQPVQANGNSTAGALWFPAPLSTASFSTTFQVNFGGSGSSRGFCFVIQNGPPAYQPLQNVQITGTNGALSFNATQFPIATNLDGVGQFITVSGTNTGSGSLPGYSNPTTYYIGSTNGSTTAVLETMTLAATSFFPNTIPITAAVAGTTTGLTFSLNAAAVSGGPSGMGAGYNALGYGGMSAVNSGQSTPNGMANSVAVAFNMQAINSGPANSVGLYTNGANPYGSQTSMSPVSFTGNVTFTLAYNGTALTLTATQGANTFGPFTLSSAINIASIVGGSTAYFGFTAGCFFGTSAVISLNNWAM